MKRFVLITGASGDIGKEIARLLARKNYSLYLHYNENITDIKLLLEELTSFAKDCEFIPIQADLSSETGCHKLAQEIYQLDGIIHNSGISIIKPLTNMMIDEINQLIYLHLTAPILITKLLIPKMIHLHKGNIIFISSIWGQTGASCETVYSATKGGQIAFAKALSKELAPSNIRVNVVSPGAVETKMLADLNAEEKTVLTEEIPLGRLATPRDVANAVQFLLAEDASYITGQVLNVNGGWYM